MTEPLPKKYTYDFGQNMAGFVSVKMKGKRGVRVMFKFGEMLNTNVSYQNPGEKSVKNGDGPPGTVYRKNFHEAIVPVGFDYYTFKGNEVEEFTPRFTFHGFRYVEISGVDSPPESVIAIAFSSDNIQTSSFETSNSKVNKLYSNIYWTMRSNFVSVPTDSPSLDERLGWLGDAEIFSGTAVYFSNSAQFYSKWLQDIRSYQMNVETSDRDKGLVPFAAPALRDESAVRFSNFWSDAAVIVPWLLYEHYGDKRIILESYESMKAWCDFLNSPIRSQDYIRLSGAPRDADWGDWLAVQGTPKDLMDTLVSGYSNKLF
jgi:alpha-L-rhamnosidase